MRNATTSSTGSTFRVGWSMRDISPEGPVLLYGQLHPRLAREVRHPITLTALVLERGGEVSVLVSCDIVAVSGKFRAAARAEVAARLPELNPRRLILFATHTHTAPYPVGKETGFAHRPHRLDELPEEDRGIEVIDEAAYGWFVVERLADAVAEAWEGRAPASVGNARAEAVLGRCRRAVYTDGSAKMYGPVHTEAFAGVEGYEDHNVDLLYFWNERDELTGIVVNVPCPSQVLENERFVSSDYWHFVRERLRERFGENVRLLAQCAPAGDLSPHHLLDRHVQRQMRLRRGTGPCEEIAAKLLRAVEDGLPLAEAAREREPAFGHLCREIDLPKRSITDADLEVARELATGSTNSTHRHWAIQQLEERREAMRTEPSLRIELDALRLGDCAMCFSPFELFLAYGLRIRNRSHAPHTFNIQLAGHEKYLPTARACAGGHYSAIPQSNLVGPEGGEVLVEETLHGIARLFPEAPAPLNVRLK